MTTLPSFPRPLALVFRPTFDRRLSAVSLQLLLDTTGLAIFVHGGDGPFGFRVAQHSSRRSRRHRHPKMERIPDVLQFSIIIKCGRPFSIKP